MSLETSDPIETLPEIERIVHGSYAADYCIQNDGCLVICFEGMTEAGPVEGRVGWGVKFFRKQGINVLTFLEEDRNRWYRSEDMYALVEKVRAVLDGYSLQRRISYGPSMGGYGASAFAKALGCDEAILMAPISTLNHDVAPWDHRFPKADKQDWTGPYFDAVNGAQNLKKIYIVVDKLHAADALHADRYEAATSAEVHVYNFPGVGHTVTYHMQQLGMLRPFLDHILNGQVPDRIQFRKDAKKRRSYLHYYKRMFEKRSWQGKTRSAEVVAHHFSKFLLRNQMPKVKAAAIFALTVGSVLPDVVYPLVKSILATRPKLPNHMSDLKALKNALEKGAGRSAVKAPQEKREFYELEP